MSALIQSEPGPERSGYTVLIQHKISEFQQCPLSTNTVEAPVGNQCIGSASPVYVCFCTTALQVYRATEGKLAVVGQCQASLESVYRQCAISMSEIVRCQY